MELLESGLQSRGYTSSVSLGNQVLLDAALCSAWANRNMLHACSALRNEELERDLHISHASVLGTLRHICDGERVWLDCLLTTADGGTWRLPVGPAAELSLNELRQQWPEISDALSEWVEVTPEDRLENELHLQLPGEVEGKFPRWKILRHVLHHSTMHRGQIIGMMRMLGHQPPPISPMDYYLAKMEPLWQPGT